MSSEISALSPIPAVSSWLKIINSPILYPVPPSTISMSSTLPLSTDSIILTWDESSYGSTRKS